jgi:hypothetical protein
VIDSIDPANAAIHVTGYSVTFDGTAHTATGTVTGVGGVDLSAGLALSGTTHTSAGTYLGDGWTFTDASGNYNSTSGTVDDSIAKANVAINVTGYSVTFDGQSHTATGTATGVAGVDLSSGLTLTATSHTNAGIYTDAWTFHDGSGNYNDAAGTVNDAIAVANAAISVSGYSVTFDGKSHTATGTATGVGGVNLAADLTIPGRSTTRAATTPTRAALSATASARPTPQSTSAVSAAPTTAHLTARREPRPVSGVRTSAASSFWGRPSRTLPGEPPTGRSAAARITTTLRAM